jgi:hypothetical protein
MQRQVTGELSSVVEGDSLAQALRQGGEQANEMLSDAASDLAGEADAKQQTRGALMHGQDRLAVFCEHHQVGLPMAWNAAIGGVWRPFSQGNTACNEACRATAFFTAEAALAFGARQITSPAVVCGAGDLGVDETVDAFIGDDLAPVLAGEPAGDLLGRPTPAKPLQNRATQLGLPFEARARPASRSRLLIGVRRLVADLNAPIALQLPRDR